MKFSHIAEILLVLLLIGCGTEDDTSIIPGYIRPGDFRPRGILTKSYNLTDGTFTDGDGVCSSGQGCMAVYAFWVNNNIPVEGIAIKDDDSADSRLLMKITRVKYTTWFIKLTYKGIKYSATAGTSDISLEVCQSSTPSFPAYIYDPDSIPSSGDETTFDVSDSYIDRATLTVNNAVTLETEDKSKTITLNPGDTIVAHAFNAFTSTTCP